MLMLKYFFLGIILSLIVYSILQKDYLILQNNVLSYISLFRLYKISNLGIIMFNEYINIYIFLIQRTLVQWRILTSHLQFAS